MKESQPSNITRRGFLGLTAGALAALCLPQAARADQQTFTSTNTENTVLSHDQFLERFETIVSEDDAEDFVANFKDVMVETAKGCIEPPGCWIYPSPHYRQFFARDSYWILATLQDQPLLKMAQEAFHDDQKKRPAGDDGHIATALYGNEEKPANRDNDDESTIIDVIREYELLRAGGVPDESSLVISMRYIFNHLIDYRYYTQGDTTPNPKEDRVNAYHYWLDSFRPDGTTLPSRQMFAYNQGMLCVAIKCLEKMDMITDWDIWEGARDAYQGMASRVDNLSLPQRGGSNLVDVSSLAGDAMSLYYFDQPLLSKVKVEATLSRFSKVNYPDGQFLGFKVVSNADGAYLPMGNFIDDKNDTPGSYHNGGSWLLKDALALYSGARHQVPGCAELLLQRLRSELRSTGPTKDSCSHEFLFTGGQNCGTADKDRDNYGWNAFTSKLIS